MKSETLQLCYEHVFTRYTDHKPGSNEYTYTFPEQFTSFTGRKEVGVRSVSVIRSPRNLRLNNIYFKNSNCTVNIGVNINLSPDDDMSAANDRFRDAVKTRYTEYADEVRNARIDDPSIKSQLGINDYSYEYDFVKNEFWIKILKNDDSTYLYFPIADSYASEDLLGILGVDDTLFTYIATFQNEEIVAPLETFISYINRRYPNVMIQFKDDRITSIGFKNVWNRNTLFIASTLSTETEDKFLTLSNVVHNPLKYYDVKGFTQTFSIFLYDANKRNSVEIIDDGKDVIIIELIIYGYN